jgi:hypothetical protein
VAEIRWMRCLTTGFVHAMTSMWLTKCRDLNTMYTFWTDEWTEGLDAKCKGCEQAIEAERAKSNGDKPAA